MFRWLKNRKEKREKRRQEKHRRILNVLKSKDTTGSNSDYGFYRDDFMRNCVVENKPHDYEEIDDMSFSGLPPQFTRIVGKDFRFRTPDTSEQPPQLPARIFATTTRSMSVGACGQISNDDKFRGRTNSLPCFERYKNSFQITSDADEEPFYNEPWDCKSNLTVKCNSGENSDFRRDLIQVRLYDRVNSKIHQKESDIDSKWSKIIRENQLYSEIEDSDTGCEWDSVSQTESECSVFTDDEKANKHIQHIPNSLHLVQGEESDSDASSGFCDELSQIDEEHKLRLLKSLGRPEKTMSYPNLSRDNPFKFNTYPRTPCSKIDEDSELYLIPKRSHSLKETNTEKPNLPVQKKKFKQHQRRLGNKNRNRLLDDLIWKNNFKQHLGVL